MNKVRPQLTVIEGGNKPLPEWLKFPPKVIAPSPFDRSHPVMFRVSVGDALKAGHARRRVIVFNLWSLIFGEPPPVNCVESYNAPAKEGLICLAEAHACFKGIKRPLDTDNDGSTMVAFVLRPRMHYVWQFNLACVAKKQKVPLDLVFVVFARLNEPYDATSGADHGIVTHWQFIKADTIKMPNGDIEMLPENYSERFEERLW